LHELGIEQLPKFGEQSKRMKTVEEFEARLKQKSHQFFAYASDFLNGNFSTLPELIDFEQRRLDEHEEYMKSK
jgi:hypothetical protein